MNKLFYLCACSSNAQGGIYLYSINESGALAQLGFTPLAECNFICFSPDRKYMYATTNPTETGGAAAAYRILPDGTLEYLNTVSSQGKAACYLTCSPDGRFLYCANYVTGNVAEFSIAEDGSLKELTQLIQHTGSGPRKDRQECAHTHCTVVTPDGKYLCVNDLGIDKIMVYPLNENGICGEAIPWTADPGDGPRHILFDRSGEVAYVMNELGNSVTALRYSDGRFELIGKYTSLPSGCTEKTKASAIRLSPDERFLYASNRGFDSIACYRVVEPGKLDLFDIVSSFGSSPRDINYLPGERIFAAANEFSDVVCFYDVVEETGKLKYREGRDITLPRPLYILY